jgi:hypothetical protein
MPEDPKEYLKSLGTGDVTHNCGTDFYAHLTGVQDTMRQLTNDQHLIQAGLFHSIYGTQGFQAFTVPLEKRAEIREIVGERAEHICYVNCVMDRGSLDAAVMGSGAPCTIQAREEIVGRGNTDLPLTEQQFTDLISVHLGDWLQQVEMEAGGPNEMHGWTEAGQAWGYRRGAFRRMAEILQGPYLEMYDRVFAREPEATKGIHQVAHPQRPQPIASH